MGLVPGGPAGHDDEMWLSARIRIAAPRRRVVDIERCCGQAAGQHAKDFRVTAQGQQAGPANPSALAARVACQRGG